MIKFFQGQRDLKITLMAKICHFTLITTLHKSLKVKAGFIGNNKPKKLES